MWTNQGIKVLTLKPPFTKIKILWQPFEYVTYYWNILSKSTKALRNKGFYRELYSSKTFVFVYKVEIDGKGGAWPSDSHLFPFTYPIGRDFN